MQLDHGVPNKRWIRIISPVMIVYIFAFMDRVNFGFAMAGGMTQGLTFLRIRRAWPQGCSSSAISCFRCLEGTSPKKVTPSASLR